MKNENSTAYGHALLYRLAIHCRHILVSFREYGLSNYYYILFVSLFFCSASKCELVDAWRVFWLPFSLLLGMPKIARPLRIDVMQHTNSWSPNHFLIKNPYCCCFLFHSPIFVVERQKADRRPWSDLQYRD